MSRNSLLGNQILHALKAFRDTFCNEQTANAEEIINQLHGWFDRQIQDGDLTGAELEWADEITLYVSFNTTEEPNATYSWNGDFAYLIMDIEPSYVSDYERAMRGI